MAQTREVRGVATKVWSENGWGVVTYHSTDVVKWDESTVALNSGGWKTTTTKRRMNQAARQFDLGYYVWQHNFEWFVTTKTGTYPFVGRAMAIDRKTGIAYRP